MTTMSDPVQADATVETVDAKKRVKELLQKLPISGSFESARIAREIREILKSKYSQPTGIFSNIVVSGASITPPKVVVGGIVQTDPFYAGSVIPTTDGGMIHVKPGSG